MMKRKSVLGLVETRAHVHCFLSKLGERATPNNFCVERNNDVASALRSHLKKSAHKICELCVLIGEQSLKRSKLTLSSTCAEKEIEAHKKVLQAKTNKTYGACLSFFNLLDENDERIVYEFRAVPIAYLKPYLKLVRRHRSLRKIQILCLRDVFLRFFLHHRRDCDVNATFICVLQARHERYFAIIEGQYLLAFDNQMLAQHDKLYDQLTKFIQATLSIPKVLYVFNVELGIASELSKLLDVPLVHSKLNNVFFSLLGVINDV